MHYSWVPDFYSWLPLLFSAISAHLRLKKQFCAKIAVLSNHMLNFFYLIRNYKNHNNSPQIAFMIVFRRHGLSGRESINTAKFFTYSFSTGGTGFTGFCGLVLSFAIIQSILSILSYPVIVECAPLNPTLYNSLILQSPFFKNLKIDSFTYTCYFYPRDAD